MAATSSCSKHLLNLSKPVLLYYFQILHVQCKVIFFQKTKNEKSPLPERQSLDNVLEDVVKVQGNVEEEIKPVKTEAVVAEKRSAPADDDIEKGKEPATKKKKC